MPAFFIFLCQKGNLLFRLCEGARAESGKIGLDF